MTKSGYVFVILLGVAVVAMAVPALVLPGVPSATTIGAYIVVLFAALAVYRVLPAATMAGASVVTVVWLLLAIGGIANIHMFVDFPGASPSGPHLVNPDSCGYFYTAKDTLAEGFSGTGYNLFTLVFAGLMSLFGCSVVTLIAFNALAVLLTVIFAGYISGSVLPGTYAERCRVSTTAMVMTAMVCYLLAMGTVVLKDAFLMLGVALVVSSMLAARNREGTTSYAVLFTAGVAGILLVAAMRMQYIALMVPAAIVLVSRNRRSVGLAVAIALSAVAIFVFYEAYRSGVADRPYMAVAGGDSVADWTVYGDDSDHGLYNSFARDYISSYPIWKRLLLMPLTASVLYFIPFFWTMGRDLSFGYTMCYAHIGFPWYALGGLVLFALLFKLRGFREMLLRVSLLGYVAWLVSAYTSAGLVSRYCLAAIPLLVPSAVYVWRRCRHERRFKVFAWCYWAVVCGVLVTAYCLMR